MRAMALREMSQPSARTATSPSYTLGHRGRLPLQKKLTINSASDRYEVEADRLAEQVMGMDEPRLLHGMPIVQRQSGAVTVNQDVPPDVHQALNSSGQPLDAATRAFMEPRFGHDFSKVRIHADRW